MIPVWLILATLATIAIGRTDSLQTPSASTSHDAQPATDRTSPRRGLFLCHLPHLEAAAEAWAAYRSLQGWEVVLISFSPDESDEPQQLQRVQSKLADAVEQWRQGEQDALAAVLLLGDAGARGETGAFLPTGRWLQRDPLLIDDDDPYFATDISYQSPWTAGSRPTAVQLIAMPRMPVGRIPVRTHDQALTVLEKIQRFEARLDETSWPAHIEYVAGEGRFGPLDAVLESMFKVMIERLVPDRCTIRVSYASPTSVYCPPPDQLTETVLQQLQSPSLLFNYIGHGSATGFDSLRWRGRRYRMLRIEDVAQLQGDVPATPLALLTCCSAGWFDLPDARLSLAEALLLHPAGPPAIVAGSRPTHPYPNAVIQHALTAHLMSGDVQTVGELALRSTDVHASRPAGSFELDILAAPLARLMRWRSSLSELRSTHAGLYNLLGDPAMRLPQPALRFDSLRLFAAEGSDSTWHVHGHTTRIANGVVRITLESDRTTPARPGALQLVDDANDPELPAKAAHNHRMANDRTLDTWLVTLQDGHFSLAISAAGLPDHAVLIRATVHAEQSEGRSLIITDAVRLDRPSAVRSNPGREARPR